MKIKTLSLEDIERRNRGWLTAGNCPRVCVCLDGVEQRKVIAVHRKSGRVRLLDDPVQLDKRGKSVRAHTLRGVVRVELINGN